MSICFSGSPSQCFSPIVVIHFVILHSWLNKLIHLLKVKLIFSLFLSSKSCSLCRVGRKDLLHQLIHLVAGLCLLCCRADMNALAFLFQYNKVRRSSRLEIKATDTSPNSEDDHDDDQESMGLFELLPLELKFHIFTFLSGTGISLHRFYVV